MAFSKAILFKDAECYFSLLCKALAHPARIKLVQRLIHGEKLTVGQLASGLPLSSKTVSQHLKLLREFRILKAEDRYPNVFYSINKEMENTMIHMFHMVNMVDKSKEFLYKEEFDHMATRYGWLKEQQEGGHA